MSLFKWSSDHSVYLPEIDAEHRAIYRLADEFHKALLAGTDAEQLKPVLATNLLEAEEQHFRHEERLMKAMHYQGAGVAQEAARYRAQEVEEMAKRVAKRATPRRQSTH